MVVMLYSKYSGCCKVNTQDVAQLEFNMMHILPDIKLLGDERGGGGMGSEGD